MLMKKFLVLATLSFTVGVMAEDCGGDILDSNGTIQSPNYPLGYPVDTSCIWSFNTVQSGEYVLAFHIVQVRMYYYVTASTKKCTASLKIQSNAASPDEVDCKSYENEETTTCYTYRSSDGLGCQDIQSGSEYENCTNGRVEDSDIFKITFESNNDKNGTAGQRIFKMTYCYAACPQDSTKASTSFFTSHLTPSSKPYLSSSTTLDLSAASNLAASTPPPPMSVVPIFIGSLFAVLILIAIAILVVIRRKRAKSQSKDKNKQPSSAIDDDAPYNLTSLKNRISDEQININGALKADDDEGLYSQLQRDRKINQAYSPTKNQSEIPKEDETNESFTNEEPSDENPYHHLVRDLSSDVKDSKLEHDGEMNQTNNPASQYEVVSDGQINESFTDGDQTDENPYHQLSRDMPADVVKLQEFNGIQEDVNDYDHLQTGNLHDNQGNQAYDVNFKPEDTYDHLASGLNNPAKVSPAYTTADDTHASKHNPNISQYEEIRDLQVSRQNSSPATHENQGVIQPSAPTENYTRIIPKSERASEENKANA